MTKILEFRKPKITVNPALNRTDDTVMFPEKLAHATAMIEKYGIPKEWEAEILQREQEQAFWQKGVLIAADIATNTFSITAEATDNQAEKTYKITALPTDLNKIVKENWGEMMRVHIKPKGDLETATAFDLIEVF